MLVFACLSPHPPLILPSVGSEKDRQEVKKTITSLEKLGKQLAKIKPDCLIITSPHPDWGFNVPLHYLAKNLHGIEVKAHLTDLESPEVHFNRGKELIKNLNYIKKLAWVASGDMSHRLKEDGPYGLHPSGPKFDKEFINLLKRKDIGSLLNIDPKLIDEAGECGLRSFCQLLGALEGAKVKWQSEILSYEAPFGVGYLVANFKIKK
ncbi:MAG TPA: class III extradiol dioxygenase subunit B-like domain-containing protein [Patescibacteria group bacterium]|nr:class III extradiol dioxygenase subunit B-like domain-containing protein [Patescibacteria group bacterium]